MLPAISAYMVQLDMQYHQFIFNRQLIAKFFEMHKSFQMYGSVIYRTARPPTTAAPRIPQAAVSRATAPAVEDAVVLEVWVAEEPEPELELVLEPELPLCA